MKPEVGKHAAELASGAPLLHERRRELLLGDGAVLDQHLAEADSAFDVHGLGPRAHCAKLLAHLRIEGGGVVDFLASMSWGPLRVVVDHDGPQQDHELGAHVDLLLAVEQIADQRNIAQSPGTP